MQSSEPVILNEVKDPEVKKSYVYILASKRNGTLYTGVTADLEKRMYAHKYGTIEGFTKKYKIDKLVHFEEFGEIYYAISREKEIKGWLRKKKLRLIEANNPDWNDLAEDWFSEQPLDSSLRSE